LYLAFKISLLVLVLVGAATLAAFFFARRITVPLRQLAVALKGVADGKFDTPIGSETVNYKEVAELWQAFESMRKAVQCREQCLRDAHARTAAVVGSSTNPIITIDEKGCILHANNATCELFGYSISELEGRNVSMLMPLPDREAHDRDLQNYLEAGDAKTIGKGHEVIALRNDGTTFPINLGVAEVPFGAGRNFVATVTDLTEQKRLERLKLEEMEAALKLEKLKGDLVATVSHELRTPLTSIKGSLALLTSERLGALPEKAKSMMGIAYSNSERLARLINDILDIDKINAGQMSFAIQPIEVLPLLREAARANSGYADQFGVRIKVMPVPMGTAIMADPDRIAQALTNLISNAVKYSPKDSAVVLSARRMNGTVRICVTDKGPGIPEKFHSQVFARFAQADSAEARRKGGTGLGLSISKAIAEAHGGSIGFKSIEGRGATFFIDIPARCKPRAAEATERRALAS
jgi:PAS domain S-box-containing protein